MERAVQVVAPGLPLSAGRALLTSRRSSRVTPSESIRLADGRAAAAVGGARATRLRASRRPSPAHGPDGVAGPPLVPRLRPRLLGPRCRLGRRRRGRPVLTGSLLRPRRRRRRRRRRPGRAVRRASGHGRRPRPGAGAVRPVRPVTACRCRLHSIEQGEGLGGGAARREAPGARGAGEETRRRGRRGRVWVERGRGARVWVERGGGSRVWVERGDM